MNATKNICKEMFKDELLIASFLSSLFIGIAQPTVHRVCMANVSTRMISLNSIIICIAGIIVPALWTDNGKKLYKYFALLGLLEASTYIITVALVIMNIISIPMYYIIDTLAFSIITKNLICGGNMLRNKRYDTQDKRNKYDNLLQIACNSSSIIGYGINLIYPCGQVLAFTCMAIGISFDNWFYIKAWKKTND